MINNQQLTVSPLCPGWPGSPSFPGGPWRSTGQTSKPHTSLSPGGKKKKEIVAKTQANVHLGLWVQENRGVLVALEVPEAEWGERQKDIKNREDQVQQSFPDDWDMITWTILTFHNSGKEDQNGCVLGDPSQVNTLSSYFSQFTQ